MADKNKKSKNKNQEISLDFTINLHQKLHGIQFKKKAKRAIAEIKRFAKRTLATDDVRIDTKLNQFIWSNGIRNVPRKVRVRISRRKQEDENKSSFFALVQHVPVENFSGLLTEVSKLKK